MNQSAINMLQKAIEFMNKDLCLELMPEMIPPLLTVSWKLIVVVVVILISKKMYIKVWDANSHNLSATSNVSAWGIFDDSACCMGISPMLDFERNNRKNDSIFEITFLFCVF